MLYARYLMAPLLLALAANASDAREANPRAKTQTTLTQLEKFLQSNPNGTQWPKYLQLDVLHRELARSGAIDRKALAAVLDKFKGNARGLNLPEFQALREALAAWIAELSLPEPQALGDAITEARSRFQSISPGDVNQARSQLEQATKALNGFLSRQPKVAASWQKYLRLPELQTQLAPGATPDRELLAKISERFSADKSGLETPEIRSAGLALAAYVQLLEAASATDLEKQYDATLSELGDWFAKYSADPNEEAAAEISQRLAWLKRMHQAGGLVQGFRRAYERPNVLVAAKSGIVGAGINQKINDVSRLNDNILGTQISGTGHTVGQLKAELVPDAARAAFDIVLNGTTYSNTVGYNGPATIYSTGTTQISGRQRVLIDALGIRSQPASANAVTRTVVTGVAAGRRQGGLVNSIAQQRVAEGKSQAEAVGSQHAEARIRARLEKEVATSLGRANQDFLQKFRYPLVRRHQFPRVFDLNTSRDLLHAVILTADETQLGALGDVPELDETNYDLAVRLHESAANNYTGMMLSGVTLRDGDVRKSVLEMRGSLPPQLQNSDDQEPWSITFEKFRPVTVSIRDGGFEITLRGHRYTTGENDENKYGAMYVTARYKAEQGADGYRLVRQGDLEIEPPTQGRQSTKVVALKAILRRKFGKLFTESIEPEPLEFAGKWKAAGKLGLAQLQTDKGWAVIGWRKLAATKPGGQNVANKAR